uniref:Uncharacterized protein n=1 Tax=viral metagenome TaxID=1070528 RepID=A0A6M3L4U2_9ZZZZ
MKGDKRREKKLEEIKAAQCAPKKELSPEDMQKQREYTKRQLELNIKTIQKEISFKEAQISTKQILEKNDNYIDGKKRDFEIQFEIEMKKIHLDQWIEQLAEVKKLLNENRA